MKRKLIYLSLALTALVMISVAIAQPGVNRRRPGRPMIDPARQRQSTMAARQLEQIRRQIDTLKADHESLITELKAIHATAKEEEAEATADRLEKFMAARQKRYETRLGRLESRQKTLGERAGELQERIRRPGRKAPDFELESFDGRNASLEKYRGRVIVLEWFNPGCPFSRYHHETKSTMADLARKYKDKEVVWLAVNSTHATTPEANRQFAKTHKIPYPVLDDRSGKVGHAFGARTTPHMFVIDQDGYIVYNGAVDNAPMGKVSENAATVNYVDQALEALTSGKEVTTSATPPYGCSVKYGN